MWKDSGIVTLRTPTGTKLHPRMEPCPECPWRKDGLGKSPKEVFEIGKVRGPNSFGCHMAAEDEGGNATLICAGYLAVGDSNKNEAVRFARHHGSLPPCSEIVCTVPMFGNYDEMAVAHLEHGEKQK